MTHPPPWRQFPLQWPARGVWCGNDTLFPRRRSGQAQVPDPAREMRTLLEWPPMNPKRCLRHGLALLGAILHLAVPVAAYAMARSAAAPGDYCSATRAAAAIPARRALLSPLSSEHHCAHAPCCTGSGASAAAPAPPAPVTLWTAGSHPRPLPGQMDSVRVTLIAAAQPRGPPRVR